jgi:hypothetical protein
MLLSKSESRRSGLMHVIEFFENAHIALTEIANIVSVRKFEVRLRIAPSTDSGLQAQSSEAILTSSGPWQKQLCRMQQSVRSRPLDFSRPGTARNMTYSLIRARPNGLVIDMKVFTSREASDGKKKGKFNLKWKKD